MGRLWDLGIKVAGKTNELLIVQRLWVLFAL